jgi:signal transduction histidine kinase
LGVASISGIELKPDQAQIQISFLAMFYEAGEVLRYQFMLADADHDWGQPTQQRTVTYANLAPGAYRFLVRAINTSGATKPAIVAFSVLPHVWQRWWFLGLCLCAAVSIAYGLHVSRVSQLLHLERVRTRIATDLHDDFGASLSQIAVVSEALGRDESAEGRFRESLTQIAADSRELVASMSDLVWSIDPRRDHLQDLIQRMRRFSSDMFTASSIQFQFSTSAADLPLSPDQRRQMFLIFKEGVNNIVRHSGATEAKISLLAEENSLSLKVSDNGRGLNHPSQAGQGNGLKDMRARAMELGGTLEITGGRHGGTDITINVPLRRMSKPRWNAFFHPNKS